MIFGITKKELCYCQIAFLIMGFIMSGIGYLIMDDANYLSSPRIYNSNLRIGYEPISSDAFFIVWFAIFITINIMFFCMIWIEDGGFKKLINNLKTL